MSAFPISDAPLQKLATLKGVELWVKREDLIHPEVSGNKWRKLKYFLEDFRASGKEVILTFGGAYSNHLAAVAALGRITGIPVRALVRGEEVLRNPTLDYCRAQGMEVEAISRKEYATKDEPEFLQHLAGILPGVYVIPEGGKGPLGVKGCTEITRDLPEGFSRICCAAGTGTTAAGLLAGGYPARLRVYSPFKGGRFLAPAISRLLRDYYGYFSTAEGEQILPGERLDMRENYHFGGFGKTTGPLIDFMNRIYRQYQLPLDPVYTGKMFYGVWEEVQRGAIPAGEKLLLIHTGGRQGIRGMNEKLRASGKKTLDYES